MTALIVAKVGPVTSVQDHGRYGWQRFGVSTAGAMDKYALAAANALVGQPANAAAIEIGPMAAQFVVIDGPIQIALVGAERSIIVGGKSTRMDVTLDVASNQMIEIGRCRSGVFSYLALGGGIVADEVLGSKSAHPKAQLGSPYRRHLSAGDSLPTTTSQVPIRMLRGMHRAGGGPIRVVLGPQTEYFSAAEIEKFLKTDWRISAASDRTCYRLDGPAIEYYGQQTMVTDGTANGSIQIAGNGQPLVLLADRGPMGGYPKIAVAITADLGRFAQTRAGELVRFESVNVEDAQDATREFLRSIRDIPSRIRLMDFDAESMLRLENVAGRAVNALDVEEA